MVPRLSAAVSCPASGKPFSSSGSAASPWLLTLCSSQPVPRLAVLAQQGQQSGRHSACLGALRLCKRAPASHQCLCRATQHRQARQTGHHSGVQVHEPGSARVLRRRPQPLVAAHRHDNCFCQQEHLQQAGRGSRSSAPAQASKLGTTADGLPGTQK